ncbi:hypothetical protein NHX12_027162 [Muraenolepis orangiensis]|uniref:Uncharacterized protein n=1 Tax=Muraenolepis orangiensis TaxID=630683 RepID=A0A9Q0ILM4_9TELE|nr:hypothetical protein NHX12_027162 [Muraenolepis orangiensis]
MKHVSTLTHPTLNSPTEEPGVQEGVKQHGAGAPEGPLVKSRDRRLSSRPCQDDSDSLCESGSGYASRATPKRPSFFVRMRFGEEGEERTAALPWASGVAS